MVIAGHWRAAAARAAMGIDERLRIDFEVGFWVRMNISCWQAGVNLPGIAKQDAAAFVRVRSMRLVQQACDQIT